MVCTRGRKVKLLLTSSNSGSGYKVLQLSKYGHKIVGGRQISTPSLLTNYAGRMSERPWTCKNQRLSWKLWLVNDDHNKDNHRGCCRHLSHTMWIRWHSDHRGLRILTSTTQLGVTTGIRLGSLKKKDYKGKKAMWLSFIIDCQTVCSWNQLWILISIISQTFNC